MILRIDEIARLYVTRGAAAYGDEAVTLLEHALQCAWLAEQAGSSPELIAAALLHDLGHLLASYAEKLPDDADDAHQYVPVPFLRGLFPDAVIEPIRLHVDAKRYLCTVDSAYWSGLSPASKRSLALQGGRFSAAEATRFLNLPFAADAVAIRRWDDRAKEPLAKPPAWSHYLGLLHGISRPALASAT